MMDEIASGITLVRDVGVNLITLNKPARRNALDQDMRVQLARRLRESMFADADCQAVVLTGAGAHFCSGADVSQMGTSTVAESRRRLAVLGEVFELIACGPKPVVAAVEGLAYGAGFSLAMAADHVVASTDARFAASFLKVALLPDAGVLWSLRRRVGDAQARSLLMLASEIDGCRAVAIGAADEAVPPGTALERALTQARRWACEPPTRWATLKTGAENLRLIDGFPLHKA